MDRPVLIGKNELTALNVQFDHFYSEEQFLGLNHLTRSIQIYLPMEASSLPILNYCTCHKQ